MTSKTIFIFTIIIAIGSIINSASISSTTELPDDYKVVFVSALFRHGDRAPAQLYPGTLTTLADITPPGLGQLTAAGKERARQLGVVLHQRYNDLLGEIYNPNELIARSTDTKRTKKTLVTVLGVLYPGEQSIPVEIVPTLNDTMLLSPYTSINYCEELEKVRKLPEVEAKASEFEPLRNDLIRWTHHDYKNSALIRGIHHEQISETFFGLELPHWARNSSVQQQLKNVALFEYDIHSYNVGLRRFFGGVILKNMTESMKGIAEGRIQDGRKIQLIAGHEETVAALLATIGVFKPHVPAYSSCVIVELLRNSDSQYYVQVLYYLGIPAEITTLQIPGCSNPCPLSTFVKLMKDMLPTEDIVADSNRCIEWAQLESENA